MKLFKPQRWLNIAIALLLLTFLAFCEKLLKEDPEYFVFNGASKALATQSPLRAKVGETIRIFFGVGGPNYISSHIPHIFRPKKDYGLEPR
ncbi:hypothetical protein VB715_13440 [Crocosphaera sp. UHCC 0190]|uniref:hypothetical protein n=1 Tax=Crocosphaera sp. UHCC 0190 TaxID=3110246 RepID=UPI002B20746B|nr:hypothetical protein [Crocosphaera sp. UHCC 0190]MEA5510772.1 hypothetical protein [Crocosphaera sp. UHCC 0190]